MQYFERKHDSPSQDIISEEAAKWTINKKPRSRKKNGKNQYSGYADWKKQIYLFLTRDHKSEIYEDASALMAFTATMNAAVDIWVYLSSLLKGPETVHEISKPSLRFYFLEPIAELRMNFMFSGRLCVVIYVVNHFTTPPSNKCCGCP